MKLIYELFGKNIEINKIEKKGKTLIVDVNNNKYVIKSKNKNVDLIYDYLSTRGFNYYPKKLFSNDEYDVFEYIDNKKVPYEQKAYDMIELLSILHDKTSYYKDIDINEYKELFENIINKIDFTYNYYTNLILRIEQNMFMSPSGYLLSRNISKVFQMLNYSRNTIMNWYDIIKLEPKNRVVTLYNNIDLDHILINKKKYLISWDKSIKGNPIYDLYQFYEKYSKFDFDELLKHYESKFSLLKEEKMFLYVLISIPNIVEFTNDELHNCKSLKKMIDNLYKTEVIVSKNKKTD